MRLRRRCTAKRVSDIYPVAGDCRAGVHEHLYTQTYEQIYLSHDAHDGCTIEVVRDSTQYWQIPRL